MAETFKAFRCECHELKLFKDLEASGGIFSGARAFAVCAAAARIKIAAVTVQPGTVKSVWVFEGHDITILHRSTISGVLGKDLERYVVIVEPVVSRQRADCPVGKKDFS